MRTIAALLAVPVLATLLSAPARADDAADRQLILYLCSRCHAADQYYLSDRSKKAWQLTVKRMQDNYYSDDAFTDKQADRIVAYLAANPYEEGAYKPRAPIPAATTQPTSAPSTTSAPTTRRTTAAPPPPPRSPAKATLLAKGMGYVSVGILAVLIVTGFFRKKLGPTFRKLHGVMALTLCACLAIHVSVFLVEYGAPSVLWLWFGIIATLVIIAGQLSGMTRSQNRRVFLMIHIPAAVIGLVGTILHWIWIYV